VIDLVDSNKASLNLTGDRKDSAFKIFLSKLTNLPFDIRLGLTYLLVTVLYILLYMIDLPVLSVLKAISGIASLIFIPGIILHNFLFCYEKYKIWLIIVLGSLTEMILIYIQFLLSIFLSYQFPVLILLISLNTLLVGSFLASNALRNNTRREVGFDIKANHTLYLIVLVGLGIRIILGLMSTESIAPDASLYSDFGRNIVDGIFNTNVLTDGRIYSLTNGTEYPFHCGFVFLSALSFLIANPLVSGPVVILLLVGTGITLLGYDIVRTYFGHPAGVAIAAIISFQPIFVFHSVVAYGPEICSLLFVVAGMFLLIGAEDNKKMYLLSGIIIGLSDIIWTSTFLLFCAGIPVFLFISKIKDGKSSLLVLITLFGVAASRVFILQTFLFILVVGGVGLILLVSYLVIDKKMAKKFTLFFLALQSIILIWRYPVVLFYQVFEIPNLFSTPAAELTLLQIPNPPIEMFTLPFQFEVVFLAGFFVIFHLSIPLFTIVLLSFLRGFEKRVSAGLVVLSIIGFTGTLFVLNALAAFKDILTIFYIYSDSRFFVSIIYLLTLSTGSYFAKYLSWEPPSTYKNPSRIKITTAKRRLMVIGIILLIGFIPGYIVIPTGLNLITSEQRYGWGNLNDELSDYSESESVFIVDRAPEFSWFTGFKSAEIKFVRINLPSHHALERVFDRASQYDAKYFLLDGYTVARWGTLSTLLHLPFEIDSKLPIYLSQIVSSNNESERFTLPSISLLSETLPNVYGDYSRVYNITNGEYEGYRLFNLLESGWVASNGGSIINETGKAVLSIGANANYTNSWRPMAYDLNLVVEPGVLIFRFSELTATIARIEFYDSEGIYLMSAESIQRSIFYAYICDCTIGDIRIVIEGNPGDSVTLDYEGLWTAI